MITCDFAKEAHIFWERWASAIWAGLDTYDLSGVEHLQFERDFDRFEGSRGACIWRLMRGVAMYWCNQTRCFAEVTVGQMGAMIGWRGMHVASLMGVYGYKWGFTLQNGIICHLNSVRLECLFYQSSFPPLEILWSSSAFLEFNWSRLDGGPWRRFHNHRCPFH